MTITALPGLEVLVSDDSVPEGVATGITDYSLELVREDGTWRVENCGDIGE